MTVVIENGDLIARVEGSASVIRLNRPKATNAVPLCRISPRSAPTS
jgi:hypothetical protein